MSAEGERRGSPGRRDPALERARLHAPLVPRRSRAVGLGVAAGEVVVLTVLALVLPGEGIGGFRWYDRLGIVLVALAVAGVLWVFGTVRAVPSEQGLLVRNLTTRRRLEWAEIVQVQFGGGGPWAVLDLSDGSTLPVMAIQRADGAHGQRLARRLATLVALHEGRGRDG